MRRPFFVTAVLLIGVSSCTDDDGDSGEPPASGEDVVALANHIEAALPDEVIVSDTSTLGLVVVSILAEGNADATVREVCLSALEVRSEVPVGLVVLAGDGRVIWESDGGNADCPPG